MVIKYRKHKLSLLLSLNIVLKVFQLISILVFLCHVEDYFAPCSRLFVPMPAPPCRRAPCDRRFSPPSAPGARCVAYSALVSCRHPQSMHERKRLCKPPALLGDSLGAIIVVATLAVVIPRKTAQTASGSRPAQSQVGQRASRQKQGCKEQLDCGLHTKMSRTKPGQEEVDGGMCGT